ncbi:MAG TPA: biotin--[acetyl-CoA-carboxylase] ligase [Bacillota bacterium]|nr:biotin--[acetyl-CoA-carboxylase] ligase [Bacillota bacterium]
MRAIRLGRPLLRYATLPSTSTTVGEFGHQGWPEGLAVLADEQSSGRGRLGRSWHSPGGAGVWMSVLLRPAFPPEQAPRLAITAGLSVARAIRRTAGLACDLKWPNDVLLNGRKLAGILAEVARAGDRSFFVVLGVGINVSVADDQWPPSLRAAATSLTAAGCPADRIALAEAVLEELDGDYSRLLAGEWESVRREWQAASSMLGEAVTVSAGCSIIRGRARQLGSLGELVLELEDGSMREVVAGEVTVIPAGRGPAAQGRF